MPDWMTAMIALGMVLASALTGLPAPPSVQGDLVKAELLADTDAIVPGKAFAVGVVFTIAPGWHVYWKNPGDSGLATRVEIVTPPGFSVSQVEYPVPTKFVQPGDLVAYGYADKLMM